MIGNVRFADLQLKHSGPWLGLDLFWSKVAESSRGLNLLPLMADSNRFILRERPKGQQGDEPMHDWVRLIIPICAAMSSDH